MIVSFTRTEFRIKWWRAFRDSRIRGLYVHTECNTCRAYIEILVDKTVRTGRFTGRIVKDLTTIDVWENLHCYKHERVT